MPEVEELLERLKDEGPTEELLAEIKEATDPAKAGEWARSTIKRLEGEVAQLKPQAERATVLERAPKVHEVFEGIGVDPKDLPPLVKEHIETRTWTGEGGLPTAEEAAQVAQGFGLQVSQVTPATPAAGLIAQAAGLGQPTPTASLGQQQYQDYLTRINQAGSEAERQAILNEARQAGIDTSVPPS